MEHFEICIGLIGFMFMCITGVYAWTFKVAKDTNRQLGDVYETINTHFQDNEKHITGDVVSVEVCNALHTTLKEKVDEISTDVKSLLVKAG